MTELRTEKFELLTQKLTLESQLEHVKKQKE